MGENNEGGNSSDMKNLDEDDDDDYDCELEEDYLLHASALGLNHIRTNSAPSPLRVVGSSVIATPSKLGGNNTSINDRSVTPPKHISKSIDPGKKVSWSQSKSLRVLPPPSGGLEMESSATREYPSLIHTFFLTHIVGGVFLNPEDSLYDEMLRLQGLGFNTPTGVPYTEDEIMAIVREGKQRGHIPGAGRVLPGQGTVIPPPPPCTHTFDVVKLKKSETWLTRQVNMFMKLFKSDDKFSQMLAQLESQPEYGGGSGSGGCGDDEPKDDEDGDEDEEDEEDADS
nr:probable serine/threonine protein kinase IRE [Tanacetum cinerariifolium]